MCAQVLLEKFVGITILSNSLHADFMITNCPFVSSPSLPPSFSPSLPPSFSPSLPPSLPPSPPLSPPHLLLLPSLQSPAHVWQKVGYLIELSAWLCQQQLPASDALDHLQWAADLIMEMAEEGESPGVCV